MKWTRRRRTRSPSTSDPKWVEVVAERSAAAVWAQLPAAAIRWNPAELRGYVRARAAAAVREHVSVVAADAGSDMAMSTDAWSVAIDRTVHLVMHRLWIDLPASRSKRSAA
jgi:hypothetical protein